MKKIIFFLLQTWGCSARGLGYNERKILPLGEGRHWTRNSNKVWWVYGSESTEIYENIMDYSLDQGLGKAFLKRWQVTWDSKEIRILAQWFTSLRFAWGWRACLKIQIPGLFLERKRSSAECGDTNLNIKELSLKFSWTRGLLSQLSAQTVPGWENRGRQLVVEFLSWWP